MSLFGRDVIHSHQKTTAHFPVGRMSDARKHFDLGNEIIRAEGVRESDIDECEKYTVKVSRVSNRGDYKVVTITIGHSELEGAFNKRFKKTYKQLKQNETKIDAFIHKNQFLGFRLV